jgi:hypothetical protein
MKPWIVLIGCVLSGCSAYVFTGKTLLHPEHPPRAALIVGSRTDLPDIQVDIFNREMQSGLQRCGLTSEVSHESPHFH